jgi:SAM-dependent methyltransferase
MKSEAYSRMREADGSYWWFRARREIVCATVARYVPAGSEVLDYGCGTGSIALALQSQGYRVVAADIAEEVLSVCRGAGLRTLNLREQVLPPRGVDCVLACDVLEHVDDDVGLLAAFRQTLRPGGCFVGTVPAYEFLWSGEDYVSEHYRRYTQSSLRRCLTRAGYEVVWSSYFNTLLFPVVGGVILAKRLFRPRDMYRSNVQPLPGWLNELFYRLFAAERTALRWLRFPFGVSLLVVARPAGKSRRTI